MSQKVSSLTFGKVFRSKSVECTTGFKSFLKRVEDEIAQIPFDLYLFNTATLQEDVPVENIPPIEMPEEIFWMVMFLFVTEPTTVTQLLSYEVKPEKLHFTRIVVNNIPYAITFELKNGVWYLDYFEFKNGLNNSGIFPEGSIFFK